MSSYNPPISPGSSHRVGPHGAGVGLGGLDARGGRLWRSHREQGSKFGAFGWENHQEIMAKPWVLDGLMGI